MVRGNLEASLENADLLAQSWLLLSTLFHESLSIVASEQLRIDCAQRVVKCYHLLFEAWSGLLTIINRNDTIVKRFRLLLVDAPEQDLLACKLRVK